MTKADSDKAIAAYLDALLAGTKMADKDFRLGLLDKTTAEIAATGDPMVTLALALDPLYQANREATKRRAGASSRLRPRYMQALLAKAGGLVAPDANSTLRVTFGTVKSKPGPDGLHWNAVHHAQGHRAEAHGRGRVRRAATASSRRSRRCAAASSRRRTSCPALGDVPVDFLSTVDTTGGNSGSPTLNGKGEFVGLLFDGTYDTIASDFLYDTVNTRSIHADARYMLWVMSQVDGASHLIQEMGVQ